MSRLRAAALLLLSALGLALVAPVAGHDVAMGDAQSPALVHGETYTDTAHAPGLVLYHCHIHPRMVGLLEVLPEAAPGGPVTHRIAMRDDGNATHFAAMGFVDEAGSNVTAVHLGDSITWANEGQLPHDVHILWSSVATGDTGSFEVWVAAGLVLALTGIYFAARRV